MLAHEREQRAGPGRELVRAREVGGLRRAQQLDGEDAPHPLDGLPCHERACHPHRDVVLLVVGRRDRIDADRVGERAQLAHERGGGVLGDHQAAARTRVAGQERRQPLVEARREQAERPPLGEGGEVGERQAQRVEPQRERLAVEVAGRDDARRVADEDGVVGDRVEVDRDEAPAEADALARGAVDLRDAAQRVRVLQRAVSGAPGGAGAGEHGPQALGRPDLPGERAQGVDVGVERRGRAVQRLDRQGGDRVGGVDQTLGRDGRQRAEPRHEVRAVDEGQALLGLEHERLEARGGERRGAVEPAPGGVGRLALADEHERGVRGRRQVAAGAQRAGPRHAGDHVLVQQRGEVLQHHRPHARVPAQQAVDPDGQGRAHRVARQVLPEAGGVRAQERELHRTRLLGADGEADERAVSGRHPVDRLAAGDEAGERPVRVLDPAKRRRVERHRPAGGDPSRELRPSPRRVNGRAGASRVRVAIDLH